MPVTPEVRTLLDGMAESGAPPLPEQTVAEAREGLKIIGAMGLPDEVAEVTDRTIPGPGGPIPVRVYRPVEPSGTGGLVWFHGGGWVIGDLDTTDTVARCLCNRAGVVVASVDYRLAPEHPFPAAVDDAVAAVRWVVGNADQLGISATQVAVGGDSAGGNLATVAARLAEVDLAFQLLVYPVTDCTLSSPSHEANAEGYLLTQEAMRWFVHHYLVDGDRDDPRASPLLADDLSGLPPAYIVTAEFDPLRDEGEAYGKALADAGVPVDVQRYDGMIHAFLQLGAVVPETDGALTEAARRLRSALA